MNRSVVRCEDDVDVKDSGANMIIGSTEYKDNPVSGEIWEVPLHCNVKSDSGFDVMMMRVRIIDHLKVNSSPVLAREIPLFLIDTADEKLHAADVFLGFVSERKTTSVHHVVSVSGLKPQGSDLLKVCVCNVNYKYMQEEMIYIYL